MSALTPTQRAALLLEQKGGWRYGDMLTAGFLGPCMYLRRVMTGVFREPYHVVLPLATDGSVYAGFIEMMSEEEMTYLPESFP